MKVRLTKAEKALFVRASDAARQSLTQWVVMACLAQAERQGAATEPKKKGAR